MLQSAVYMCVDTVHTVHSPSFMKFCSLRKVEVSLRTEILSIAGALPLLGTKEVSGGARGVASGTRAASSSISTFWFLRRLRATVLFLILPLEQCSALIGGGGVRE